MHKPRTHTIKFEGQIKGVGKKFLLAVKIVKELTGWGLKDAKIFIDIARGIDLSEDYEKEYYKEVLEMKNLLVVEIDRMDKPLSYYIEDFRNCGFHCTNYRKEKINNFLDELN
jgi:hypothetical protein